MLIQFRIANKLALVCGTFSLPIAVLLFLMVSGINKDIQLARMEIYGNQYQRTLEKLLQHLSDHKQASYLLSSDHLGAKNQIADLTQQHIANMAQQLDADFKVLKQVNQELGERLQTTTAGLAKRVRQHLRPEILQQEWTQIKAAAPGVAYRDKLHDHLIAKVRSLITYIGDTSSLIVDPALDSFYLVDITLLALPQMQDRLQEVQSYGQRVLAQKNISPQEQTQLHIYAALLEQSGLDRINTDLYTVFNEDANFYGISDSLKINLSLSLLEEVATHMDNFIQLNKRLAVSGSAAVGLSTYQASAQQALLSSYNLWEIAVTELDVLLQARITYYQHVRLIALLLTLLSLLTAIFLAVLIVVRGITRPMHRLFNSIALELEQQVAHRTAELANANREWEAFSYSVSHDLRAPLRGIDGFSLALLNKYTDQLDERGKHYLQRIRAGIQRMGRLIDDLLALSRVTRSEMRHEVVDLSALASSIAAELQQMQPQRVVMFIIQDSLLVQGDAHLLQIVLQNLLSNAWKFTSKHAQATIEFGYLYLAGEQVYFVRDDGSGFNMSYISKLFGAFQRLHDDTEFEGIGIGLATVQRILHRHGGRIWAEGAVEQGATFYFTIPAPQAIKGISKNSKS
ncbi:MAG: ATP-binding protein [Gallionellaceae bacterium]|nr:ATP-binding protein [Gallionellaceae bacterium]